MKISTKLGLLASVLLTLVSCKPAERSTASYYENDSFEMDDVVILEYFNDGLMFSPYLTWNQITYFCSQSDETNIGYRGGFKLSSREGSELDDAEQATFTSAGEGSGVNGSNCYMAYLKTPYMPEYDIKINLANFYSSNVSPVGCYIVNSLYNSRLKEQGLIEKGDLLKVIVEFYSGGQMVGSLGKYIVDYSGPELKMADTWTEWNMSEQAKDEGITIPSYDAVKFKVEVTGEHLKPCFCIDTFVTFLKVVY